jgi:hypothetical protein
MSKNDLQHVQHACISSSWQSRQRTEHYQANKKKNIQYEIFLLKKRRPKDSSIYLSTLVLNQVKKERILF